MNKHDMLSDDTRVSTEISRNSFKCHNSQTSCDVYYLKYNTSKHLTYCFIS